MKTLVYYFSGTGNSFALAKEIAEKIGADLISIANVVNESKSILMQMLFVLFFLPTWL